jgi:hypothetical protein
MFKTIALRALRGFVAGGLANLAAIFAANQFNVASLQDLRNLGFAALTGFLVGGLLSLDKLLRYEVPPAS